MSDPQIEDKKEPEEKVRVNPIASNMRVFEWIEDLFNGEQEFPNVIEVRLATGKGYMTNGPKLKQRIYQPTDSKPDRETLVKDANKLTAVMQTDCDVKQKPTVYALCAINFSRDAEPYDRALIQLKPGQSYRLGENGDIEQDDEEQSIEKRHGVQMMGHMREMFQMSVDGWAGIVDRQDRTLERVMNRLDTMETRYFKMLDAFERSLDLKEDREAKRRKDELWVKGAEKMLELGVAIAPPIVNAIAGKSVIPQPVHPDVVELKKFLKRDTEGGKMTKEQQDKLLGIWDESTSTLLQPGVLTVAQISTLFQVAGGQLPVDELDKLLPGGPYEITGEQLGQLQMIFASSMEQVMPLVLMFNARKQRREQANNGG